MSKEDNPEEKNNLEEKESTVNEDEVTDDDPSNLILPPLRLEEEDEEEEEDRESTSLLFPPSLRGLVGQTNDEEERKTKKTKSSSKKGSKSKKNDGKKKSKRKKRRKHRLEGLEPTAAEKFEIFNEELYQAQQNHHFPFMKFPLSRQAYHLMKYKNFSFQNLLTLKSYIMNHCVPYVLTYSSILFKEDMVPSLFPAEIIQGEYEGKDEKLQELEKQIEMLQKNLDEHLVSQTELLDTNLKKIEESLSRKKTFELKRAKEKKIYQNIKIATETCFEPLLYANDIFTIIFEFLSLGCLSRLMRTCWLFHTLITDKVRVSVELPLNFFSKYPISDRLTYFQRIRKLHIVRDINLPVKEQHLMHYDDPFDHTATITNKIHVATQIIQIIQSNVGDIESLLLPDLSGQRSKYPYYRGRRDQRGRVRQKRQSENLEKYCTKLDVLIGQCSNLRMFQSPNFFPQPIPGALVPRWKNLELVNCRFDTKTIKNIPQTVKILLLYPPRQAFDRWEWQQQERGMSLEEKRGARVKQMTELVEKKEVMEEVVMKLKNLRTLRLPMILFVRDDPRSGFYARDGQPLDDEEDLDSPTTGTGQDGTGGIGLSTVSTKKLRREKHQAKMASLQLQLRITPVFLDFVVNSKLKSLNILTPAYYRVTEAPVYDTLMEGVCQRIGKWKSIRSLKLTFLHYTMPLFFQFFSNLRNRHYKLFLFQIRNNEPMEYDFRYGYHRGTGRPLERKTSFERIDVQDYDFSFTKKILIDKLMVSITSLGYVELDKLDFFFNGMRIKYLRLGQLLPTERVIKCFFGKLNAQKHKIGKLVILFQKWSINQFTAARLPQARKMLDQDKNGESEEKKKKKSKEVKEEKKEVQTEEGKSEVVVSQQEDVPKLEEEAEGEGEEKEDEKKGEENEKKKKGQGNKEVMWISVDRFLELLTILIEKNKRIKELHLGRDYHRKDYRNYGPVRWSVLNDLEGVNEDVIVEFCKTLEANSTLRKVFLPPLKRSIILKIKKVLQRFEKLEKRVVIEECRKDAMRY